jgi:hypothetical protein
VGRTKALVAERMEEAGGGEISNRPIVGIDLGELGRSALGHFPKQLVFRERVGMEFEDCGEPPPPADRRLGR